MNEKKWDLSTVTTSDFTVEVAISQKFWDYWLKFKQGERALFNETNKNRLINFHKYFHL
mgnify:CR=1 FL=1